MLKRLTMKHQSETLLLITSNVCQNNNNNLTAVVNTSW